MNSSDLKVVPYLEVDGVRTFRDSELMTFYRRIMEESPHVFGDGSIGSPHEFVREFKHNPDNQLFVPLIGNDPVGLIWFNHFQHAFAQGHFCFFKKYWGTRIIVESTRRILGIFFRYNSGCNVVIGIIPSKNLPALKFVRRLGAETVGVIKLGYTDAKSGEADDAVVIQIMRGEPNENLS